VTLDTNLTSIGGHSGADGLFSISDAVESMSGAFASDSGASGPAAAILKSPEHLTKAIQLVEVEEADWGSESLIKLWICSSVTPEHLFPTWNSPRGSCEACASLPAGPEYGHP